MMPRLSRLTAALLALLLLHGLAIPLIFQVVAGTPRSETLIGHLEQFAHHTQSNQDSWEPMSDARAYATTQSGVDIYEEIFFRRKVKFQYPPSALLFTHDLSYGQLNVISWCAVWLTVIMTVVIFRAALLKTPRRAFSPIGKFDLAVALLAAAGLGLTFYPLLKGYTLGQIQVWVDALFAATVWAWYSNRKLIAGVCLGVTLLIKPALTPLVLWAMLRREWRLAFAAAATTVVGLAVSVAAYGLVSHLTYLRVLFFIASRGEAFYPNQSVNGLLNRWFGNGDNLVFQSLEFSPYHPVVAAGTTITSGLLYACALILPAVRRNADTRFDFPIMALTATMASPIAWEHHYGIVLPLLAILVPATLERSPLGRWTAASLMVSFILLGQYVQPAQRFAFSAWNPLQSYMLFGGLVLLVTAYVSIFRSLPPRSPCSLSV